MNLRPFAALLLATTSSQALHLTAGGHAFRVKTVDYYTGSIRTTSLVAVWANSPRDDSTAEGAGMRSS